MVDDEEKTGFVRAPLFVRSAMFRRKDDNAIMIEMTCHEDAKRLFFNLQVQQHRIFSRHRDNILKSIPNIPYTL